MSVREWCVCTFQIFAAGWNVFCESTKCTKVTRMFKNLHTTHGDLFTYLVVRCLLGTAWSRNE